MTTHFIQRLKKSLLSARAKRARHAGFTLVETLVAITILALALTGPFYAIQHSLAASDAARDNLIAASLGQEAIEYIRSVRDNNYLNNNDSSRSAVDWLSGLDLCRAGKTCTVDPTQNTINQCPTNAKSCLPLTLSNGNNPYIYSQVAADKSHQLTRFTRSVQITDVPPKSPDTIVREEKVTVTVSWISAQAPYSITVVDYLDNWL